MFQNKNINLGAPWYLLTVFSVLLVVSVFNIVNKLLGTFSVSDVIGLTALVSGAVVLTGGYVLTRRSSYEVYPTHSQVFGALISGVLLTVCLYLLIMTIGTSLSIGFFLLALMAAVEFLVQRSFQSRRLTFYRTIAFVILAGAVYLFATANPSVATAVYSFAGLFLLKELLDRYTHTHLLSPWVNSIWGGLVIMLAGFIAVVILPSTSLYSAEGALTLPLWVGFAVLVVGAILITLQFLKRKITIVRGYLQHKLQFLTLLLWLVSHISGVSTEMSVGFLLLVASYSVAETSIFPKT